MSSYIVVRAIHRLRVNMKSLTYEAKIIREEIRKAGTDYKGDLYQHKTGRLREESRYTNLALGYVRGRTYKQIESNARDKPSWKRLHEKITRNIWTVKPEEVQKWLEAA